MSGDIAKIACLLHDASQSKWPSSVSNCCMNLLNVMLAPCLEFNTSCKRAACVDVTSLFASTEEVATSQRTLMTATLEASAAASSLISCASFACTIV